MPLELTEQIIAAMAPGEKALLEGRGLLRKGAFRSLSKTEDGTLVFGDCQGSGATPYRVSFDLATGGDRPTVRCTCPSRQFPCKHGIGLMLAFVAKGNEFKITAAPKDLLEKRAKLVEKNAKEKSAEPPAEARAVERASEIKKAAQHKKSEEQAAALDTLERFVLDLVSAGLGGIGATNIKSIHDQANRMADANLQGARGVLLRIAALARASTERARKVAGQDENAMGGPETSIGVLSDEDRQAQMVALTAQLWAMIRRGRKVLEGKIEEGESKSEADAQVESILGRVWKLPELKEAGYWVSERTLMELAHERRDDPVIEMVLTTGYLLDLDEGAVYMERSMIPYQAARFPGAKHRVSREGVLGVREAALYPGAALNRRIRWDEKDPDAVRERRREGADYARLHAHARTVDVAIKAYREQLKNPLAGSEAVVLLGASRFGRGSDGTLVMVDAEGGRLAFRDPPDASYRTTGNLAHAAAAFGSGSVAARLWYDLLEGAVYAQALALIVGEKHLRLGI